MAPQQASYRGRKREITVASIFIALALLLSVALVAAQYSLPFFLSFVGSFFLEAYGILAFAIPLYILGGALLLLTRKYRPDRYFLLFWSMVPFFTLAFTLYLWRNTKEEALSFSFLKEFPPELLLGIGGVLTFLESMVILQARDLLYPQRKEKNTPVFKDRRPLQEKRLLSGPREQDRDRPSWVDQKNTAIPFSLPEPKPLASLRRFEELEEIQKACSSRGQADQHNKKRIAPLETEAGRPKEPPDENRSWVEQAPPAEPRKVASSPFKTQEYEEPQNLEELPIEEGDRSSISDNLEVPQGTPSEEGPNKEEAGASQRPQSPAVFSDSTPPGEKTFAIDEDLRKALAAAEKEAARKSQGITRDGANDRPEAPTLLSATGTADTFSSSEGRPASGSAASGERQPANSLHGGGVSPAGGKQPYHVPIEGLLTAYPDGQYWIIDQATRDAAVILKETLKEFNIQAEVTGIRKGPVITMFEILPAPGVKLSKIVNLQDNIALRLAASSVRIVAPIPGKHAVGIEVPNRKRNIVSFREMIEGELQRRDKKMEIPVVLGKDITGEAITIDLVQTPHLLIAGATGSGKSVCVNSMILSILYQRSPAEVRLLLIDPKIVELKLYNDIPHLLTPVITEPKRAFQALQYCIYEMERRYALLDSMQVRDIRSYNRKIREKNIATERLPYIVVVIDEFADLMVTTGKELESTVARLAAMSRAVGIHLVLATQRPSIDVITGLIKANIPTRIAFMVASKMDSRIIIDMVGAEKLLGKGDMLYAGAVDPFPIRIQGAYVSEEEVERVVEYVKQWGPPEYIDDEIFYDEEEEDQDATLFSSGEDPLYEKALEIVYQQGKASASYIQRRLKIGYNRAARLVEMMEEQGIVGPAQGSKPRELIRRQ
ncbi:DNA translocase FtsK [Treponema sp. J25]|uniref:DNA translocase FtsK n=1 Tax=Treponema sp. J25 TaxID=2094121 RepID=UPI001FB5E562|nr:DNA translocase FtsK [Treponema sp. J25]